MKRDLVIGSRLSNLEEVRNFLDQIFYESELDRRHFNRILLGLSEAVCNSMRHGNELKEDKSVFISVRFEKNLMVLEVGDEGSGFDFSQLSDPTASENIRKERGRGLFLIRQFADDLQFFEGGSRVRIKYRIEDEC